MPEFYFVTSSNHVRYFRFYTSYREHVSRHSWKSILHARIPFPSTIISVYCQAVFTAASWCSAIKVYSSNKYKGIEKVYCKAVQCGQFSKITVRKQTSRCIGCWSLQGFLRPETLLAPFKGAGKANKWTVFVTWLSTNAHISYSRRFTYLCKENS